MCPWGLTGSARDLPPRVGDPLPRAKDGDNIRENDPVALRDQIRKWPAGTLGAAVDINDGAALVEIVDDNGRLLDLLTVPNKLIEVRGPRAQRSASMET